MIFIDAISYPIRGNGWIMIVIGAIFSSMLDLMGVVPLIGIPVAMFSSGYFISFYLEIVSTTMTGRNEVPDWPSYSNFIDDIISPFIRLVGIVLISFLPVLALHFANHEAEWFVPAIIIAVVYGCFYFPMAVLASQAFGGLGAALPHIVIPAIVRAMPKYFMAVAAGCVGVAVCAMAKYFTAEVPYLGWLLTAAVGLYSLMFQARLIGLIYRDKFSELGWE